MTTNGNRTAREILAENLERERKQIRLYEIAQRALTYMEGKVVNKRVQAIVQAQFDKELPGTRIWYRDNDDRDLTLGINLHDCPTMQLDHNNTPGFRLCKRSGDRRFRMAEFEEQNTSYGFHARERNAKREVVLASDEPERIQGEAEALSIAFDAYQARVDALPDGCALDGLPKLRRKY